MGEILSGGRRHSPTAEPQSLPEARFQGSETCPNRPSAAPLLLALTLSLASTGCQSAMTTEPSGSTNTPRAPASYSRAPVDWPMRFKTHQFGVRCYDTLGCKVIYAGFEHGNDDPTPSSASRGAGYLDNWNGMHGMIRNFPPPAKVTWRSKDGVAHEASIDIG